MRAASRTASLLGRGDALTDKRECARARERQQCSVTSSDERLSERTTSLESSGPLLAARTGADLEALGYRSGPRSVGQASEHEAAATKQNMDNAFLLCSEALNPCENRQWQLSVVRTSPRLASAAAASARTRRRRSLARRLATRLAADVRCARPTVRSVACAALRAALRVLLRLHCLSLLLLVVVMVLLMVPMLLLARRGSATGIDARVASISRGGRRRAGALLSLVVVVLLLLLLVVQMLLLVRRGSPTRLEARVGAI